MVKLLLLKEIPIKCSFIRGLKENRQFALFYPRLLPDKDDQILRPL